MFLSLYYFLHPPCSLLVNKDDHFLDIALAFLHVQILDTCTQSSRINGVGFDLGRFGFKYVAKLRQWLIN